MNRKEMEICLIFELQWKNNPGEKSASMGVWDKEENPALDWTTFKSYVGQNLGTLDDISVAYIDSEGDEIPIDSECEFQEALRFAWKQARNNKETIIRVDKINTPSVNTSNGNVTTKDTSSQVKMRRSPFLSSKRPIIPFSSKVSQQNMEKPSTCRSEACSCKHCSLKFSRERIRSLRDSLGREEKRLFKDSWDKFKTYSCKKDNEDEPPKWFKTYMRKFKNEITEDIKSNVSVIVRQALKKEMRLVLKHNNNEKTNCNNNNENAALNTPILKQKQKKEKSSDEESSDANLVTPEKDAGKKMEKFHKNGDKKFDKLDSKLEKLENKTKKLLERKCQLKSKCERKDKSDNESPVQNKAQPSSHQKQKKKKKSSDEDSSDAVTAQRDVKLLKKIEKLHRSGEKKFEKLDSKLEKLENKTKRLLEKKSQSKSRSDKKDKSVETVDKGIKLRKKSSDISFATCLMDAVLLDSPSSVIHCSPGEQFVKVWNVMNTGALPWTDKTELCLSWGTPGMKFEKKIIKCPQLIPGEKGRIKVKAVAPDYPGTFESYWHFYHMGDRFGHWIDCAVIVDGNHEIRFKHQACENTRNVDFDYLNNCNEKFEALGNEEKIKIKMAELTQKLNGLQIELSQQNKRCCMNEERKDQCNSDSLTNSVGSDAMKENQRKIAENMVEIQKRLDDISLLHSPPTANKILEMAFGDEFICKKDSVDEGIEESDNPDDIDLDQITGKNIEPAEWKMLQLHPEFLKSCDLLREVQIRDEVPTKEEDLSDSKYADLIDHICQHVCDKSTESKDLMDCFENNDLNKQQEISDTFSKNIEADQVFDEKKENVEEEEEAKEGNEKNLEYESDSDSDLSIMSFSMFSSSSESDDESNFIVVRAPSAGHSPECKTYQSSEGSDFQDIKVINEVESQDTLDEPQTTAPVEASAPLEKETSLPEIDGSDEKSILFATNSKGQQIFAKDLKGQPIYAVSPEGVCLPAMDEDQYQIIRNNMIYYREPSCLQSIPVYRPRRTRLGDDEEDDGNESKTKKLKSSRPSEYHFNASEIPEKTLKLNDEAPSTFTFTAGKEEKKERPCCSNCGYKPGDKRDKNGNTGKKGYNRYNNYNTNFPNNFGQAPGQGKANDKIPSVDLLPSPLLNGVLNVASTAFSTARTVLNNIKMPPMPETGCSERAKPKCRPSIEALCKLYEMGFKNVNINQKLLEMYENDVNKVIDELLNPKQ